jgi:hypothetical protein
MKTKEVAEIVHSALVDNIPEKDVVLHENQLVLELGHNQLFLVIVQDISPANEDNAERITCKKAGQIGHFQCGVCDVHNVPRFQCGCVAIKEKKDG